MKEKINYLAAILFIITIYSCDKIDAPYREESSIGIVYINQTDSLTYNGDTLAFPSDHSTPVKKVLAEDYTGHLCGNCPYAGLKLNERMKPVYGEKLVVISVHAGFYAMSCGTGGPCPGTSAPAGSFAVDYSNEASNDWDQRFKISTVFGNPCGMIDRLGFPLTNGKDTGAWSALTQSELLLLPECTIRILTDYNPVTHKLGTAVQTKFLTSQSDTFKLQVVLTEDSIVDWQEWYAPHPIRYDPDYVHRHVLRGAINSSFGQIIADGTIASGTIKLNGFSFPLNAAWNVSHCKLVAFVYDASDYRVLQVEEQDVIQ